MLSTDKVQDISGLLELIIRMRLKRILLPALCLVGVALIALPAVHAQGNFGLDAAAPSALKVNKDLLKTIGKLIQTVLSYLGVLFLILMLYAGFLYMTAQGDDKKVGTAVGIIKNAIIGLAIIGASYGLTSFVLSAVAGSNAPGEEADGPRNIPLGLHCSADIECDSGLCDNNGVCAPQHIDL